MTFSVAKPVENRPKPAFVVQELEGKRTRTIYEFDAKGKKQAKVVEVPAGYMVKFPHKGHSIRVATKEDLQRLGFDQTVPLLNEEGEAVAEIDNMIGK
jgi:hypothetical protein